MNPDTLNKFKNLKKKKGKPEKGESKAHEKKEYKGGKMCSDCGKPMPKGGCKC